MCKILNRIKEIVDNEHITIAALERTIGASKGVIYKAISKGTDIQSKWLEAIVENFPHYSVEWLLTGTGEMLKEQREKPAVVFATPKLISTDGGSESSFAALPEVFSHTPGAIPLVSEKAVGGFYNEHFNVNEHDVLAYYVIPKFRHLAVDFMIEVFGDSMMPHLYPGDIIACSIIHTPQFIQWNKPHLIATREQGLIVKRLHKSAMKDCLLAVSDNKDYAPFDIPKSEIMGMARIVGVIHIE